MRITGGSLRGRRFAAPRTSGVRPTADRVREALFARIEGLEGARVLDLYAGSGALGIESLSRGAAHCVFVERASPAIATLRKNLDALGLRERARVVRGSAVSQLRRLARAGQRFDWVFADPPYAGDEAERALEALPPLLAEGAHVILERSARSEPPTVPALRIADERRYGDTVVTRYVRSASPELALEERMGDGL